MEMEGATDLGPGAGGGQRGTHPRGDPRNTPGLVWDNLGLSPGVTPAHFFSFLVMATVSMSRSGWPCPNPGRHSPT